MQLILLQTYFLNFLLLGDAAKGQFVLGGGDPEMGQCWGVQACLVGGKLQG
jgi:hypothetical protein